MMQIEHDDYHADINRVGKSGLDLINRSPRHYWEKYLNPNRVRKEPTRALNIGTAVHHAVLEPDVFKERYYVLNDADIIAQIGGKAPKLTTRYKEWVSEVTELNSDKVQLNADDYAMVTAMAANVHSHPAAGLLLKEGVAERVVHFIEPTTGAACKTKPDWITDNGFIVDIKTTEDASPAAFARSAWNYRYHVQAAFYLDGMTYAYGEKPQGFIFVAVEKEPPYEVAVYYVTEEIYELGKRGYLKNLEVYAECFRKNDWHGYPTDVQALNLPAYAFK